MIEKNISGAQLISHDKRGGRKYWVPETDKFFIKVLSNNSFQYENVRRLISLCPKPRHIVDIGTNLAQNVIEYATFCSKVTGFEPTPFIFECAVASVEENKHLYPNADIVIHPVALGEKAGTIELAMHDNNVGKNYLMQESKARKNTVSVDIKTLDSYNLENVDLIKIDVEGYELKVIRGGIETIRNHMPVIQIEFNPIILNLEDRQEILNTLYGLGYITFSSKPFRINEDNEIFFVDNKNLALVEMCSQSVELSAFHFIEQKLRRNNSNEPII